MTFTIQSTDNLTTSIVNDYVFLKEKKSFLGKILEVFFKKEEKKYQVSEFFDFIKKWCKVTNIEKAENYKKSILESIDKANKLWQTRLKEELEKNILWIKKEIQVISQWYLKYVFEKEIAELEDVGIEGRIIYRKSLSDYNSEIPDNCMSKIIKAKKHNLFDDIIVIYTRKQVKEVALDPKKKVKQNSKKLVDPICFWEIKSLNKLYIICDRVDDECDFSLKKLEERVDVKSF